MAIIIKHSVTTIVKCLWDFFSIMRINVSDKNHFGKNTSSESRIICLEKLLVKDFECI